MDSVNFDYKEFFKWCEQQPDDLFQAGEWPILDVFPSSEHEVTDSDYSPEVIQKQDRTFRWTKDMCEQLAEVIDEHRDDLSALNSQKDVCKRIHEIGGRKLGVTKQQVYVHLVNGRMSKHALNNPCGKAFRLSVKDFYDSKAVNPYKRKSPSETLGSVRWTKGVCQWLVRLIEDNADSFVGRRSGKYGIILNLWEEAVNEGSCPAEKVPTLKALKTHLQLQVNSGQRNPCHGVYEKYLRSQKIPKYEEEW